MTPSRRIAATLTTLVLATLTTLAAVVGLAGLAPSYAGTASTSEQVADQQPPRAVVSTGYTYWAYFTWDSGTARWQLAPVGANDKKISPKDGDVFGFRWALNVGTSSAREPRAGGDFDAICGAQPATPGNVRIAYVIDYGTVADAPGGDPPPQPRGLCVNAKDTATVQQALQAVSPVRTSSSGLLCAIDDYPRTGCGDEIKGAQQPPPDQPVELALPATTTSPGPSDGSTDPSSATSNQDSDGSGNVLPILLTLAIVGILLVGAVVLRRRRS